MAEQLVLLEVPQVDDEAGEPGSGVPDWHLDERTLAVGRRGLKDARRALRRAIAPAA